MSGLVMGLVWELPITNDFTRTDKYILLAYADHADQQGKDIFPSIALVCEKTGYSERQVQAITRHLEISGLLVDDGIGRNGTNRWKIPVQRDGQGGAKIAPLMSKIAPTSMSKTAPEGIAPEGIAPEGIAPKPSTTPVKDLIVVNAASIKKLYEHEFGGLTPLVNDMLEDDCKAFPLEWIPEAMGIAVEKNVRNWKYVRAILENCKAKNVRPSLNKLENKHANSNHKTGAGKRDGQPRPIQANATDADRAAAERVKQRRAGQSRMS